MLMDRRGWIWMAHPGHFCRAWDCRFRLNAYVGGFIVSTLGELYSERRKAFETIGVT